MIHGEQDDVGDGLGLVGRAEAEGVVASLQQLLTDVLPAGIVAPGAPLTAVLTRVPDERAQAVLRLRLVVIGLSARGRRPYAAAARTVIGTWVSWLAERIDVPADQRRAVAASWLTAKLTVELP